MEKVRQREIKDYLHLYLGCEMQYSTHHEPQYETYTLTIEGLKEAIEFEDSPILRPLWQLTDEEYAVINQHGFGGASTKEIWLDQFEKFEERPAPGQGKKNKVTNPKMIRSKVRVGLQLRFYTFAPETFRYLLSQGFDLFGLIEEGLAIDKTKSQGKIKTELI